MQTTSPSLMDLVTDRQQPAPFSQIWTINWHKRWTNWTLFVNREELREVVVHMVGPWRTGKPACLYQAGTAPADILLPRRLNCLQSPDVFRLSSLATSVSVLSQQIVFGNTSCSVCENNTHHIRLVSFVRAMHTILICLVCSISKSNAHDTCLVCSVCDSNTCYICLVCSVCESNTCCICLVCSICQEHPGCSEQAEGDDVHKAGGGAGGGEPLPAWRCKVPREGTVLNAPAFSSLPAELSTMCFWVGLTFPVQPWKEIDAAVTGQEKVSDLHSQGRKPTGSNYEAVHNLFTCRVPCMALPCWTWLSESSGVALMESSGVALMESSGVALMESSRVALMESSRVALMESSRVALMESSGVALMESSRVALMESSRVALMESSRVALMESSRVALIESLAHIPSIAFRHLPPNSARFGYATEGALFISAQLSTDVVSALRKVPVLIWL